MLASAPHSFRGTEIANTLLSKLGRSGLAANLSVGAFGIAFGVLVLLLIPEQAGSDGYAAIGNIQSTTFFPLLLAIALLVTSTAYTVSTFLSARRSAPAPAWPEAYEQRPIEAPLRLLGTALSFVAYYFALETIGMIAASIVLIFALAIILGFRTYWLAALVAVAIPVTVYILFERILYVLLPSGQLF